MNDGLESSGEVREGERERERERERKKERKKERKREWLCKPQDQNDKNGIFFISLKVTLMVTRIGHGKLTSKVLIQANFSIISQINSD